MELVSVIIPTYNSELTIGDTIQSVISQTYAELELIVIDDGSTDRTVQRIQAIKDSRIRVIAQENSGAPVARNNGLANAKGNYIQFLDADDLLSENKIEAQLNAIAAYKDAIAVCDTIHFDSGTNPYIGLPSPYEQQFLFSSSDPTAFLINLWGGNAESGSMIQTSAWLTPKSVIDKAGLWSTFYSPDDDGEFFARVILNSTQIIYTPNCFNYYRKTNAGYTLSNRNSLNALTGCYRSILLKKATLNKFTSGWKSERAIGNQLMDIAIQAYPKYKILSNQILVENPFLAKHKFKINLGGKIINMISEVFGWKLARTAQHYWNFLRTNIKLTK